MAAVLRFGCARFCLCPGNRLCCLTARRLVPFHFPGRRPAKDDYAANRFGLRQRPACHHHLVRQFCGRQGSGNPDTPVAVQFLALAGGSCGAFAFCLAAPEAGLARHPQALAVPLAHGRAGRHPDEHPDLQGRADHGKPEHGPVGAHSAYRDPAFFAYHLRRAHHPAPPGRDAGCAGGRDHSGQPGRLAAPGRAAHQQRRLLGPGRRALLRALLAVHAPALRRCVAPGL